MLTLGHAALALGVLQHRLDRLCRSNAIPHTLAGRIRLIKAEDMVAIREKLVEMGVLSPLDATAVPQISG
jgi:hypothetical protein